jgi:hypothetical protein
MFSRLGVGIMEEKACFYCVVWLDIESLMLEVNVTTVIHNTKSRDYITAS